MTCKLTGQLILYQFDPKTLKAREGQWKWNIEELYGEEPNLHPGKNNTK